MKTKHNLLVNRQYGVDNG